MARTFGSISSKTRQILNAAQPLLNPDEPTTLRFILYKLISNGALESTRDYDKLVNIMRDARRGEIEPSTGTRTGGGECAWRWDWEASRVWKQQSGKRT